MQEQWTPASSGRGRRDAPRTSGFDSALAWAVVVAAHAALLWLASKALMPQRPPAAGDQLTLVWLPPPPAAEPPAAVAASSPRAHSAAPPRSPPPRAVAAAEPDSGLTAVEIAPVAAVPAVAAETSAEPAVAPSRTPWDPPPPSPKPFASRPPPLPGQGAQRFRMRPPRSIAAAVEGVGRLFGGGGPSDCDETRKNIRDLAVLGAEAVAQEVEEERRNCR
ncbi:hypothetical protein [Lysobacter enzymogenes]|uniref:hypothetical protein n=1 Tax=Lysobacter enzymogenes TaxID=69 RepID=UPI001A95A2E2|nr:hypothetical protein [Lysobacter enzymogenes]QQP95806.1 hypothetical protein JHW38_21710 [Lysobacter enzymogenes]